MKSKKRYIIYAWLLLALFVAGQCMVIVHQHYRHASVNLVSKTGFPVLKERCDVCDAMHHTHALLGQQIHFTPIVATLCHYQFRQTDATYIQLVIAAGRAPPVSV